jgi:hypothetical protein
MPLRLEVAPGDRVEIDNGRIVIHVGQKDGSRTPLTFEADASIKIRRIERREPPAATPSRRLTAVPQ